MSNKSKGRCWVFTLNFSSQDDYEALDPSEWRYARYAVWQHEIGDSGTEHYQGYVNFSTPVSLTHVKKLPGLYRAHIERVRGTVAEAARYCQKLEGQLDGPYYFPTKEEVLKHCSRGDQGKRTDIDHMCELVRMGLSDKDILEEAPRYIAKYQKGIDHVRLAMGGKGRQGPIDTLVYVGPSGTGKSHTCLQLYPPGDFWFWMSPGKWWDGYQGQPGIVFDEFRGNWMPYSYALKLLDGYPMLVEKKGGHIQMMATYFRFTSNEHPKAWWAGREGAVPWAEDPLRRRLNNIQLMKRVYVPPVVEAPFDDAESWWDSQPQPAPLAARSLFGVSMK